LGTASNNYDVDVTHSLDWDGITGDPIDEGTGLPVTDWSITSASGFNYANAVPEPATWAIALCLISLAYTQRCRRRQWPSASLKSVSGNKCVTAGYHAAAID
jgi:hypothetical protein